MSYFFYSAVKVLSMNYLQKLIDVTNDQQIKEAAQEVLNELTNEHEKVNDLVNQIQTHIEMEVDQLLERKL